jgi:hypothetical protein
MSFGQNYNIFNDLHELQQMTRGLKTYLNRDELYGTVGGGVFTGGGAPNFTVGTVLLRLRRIHELDSMLDDRRRGQFERAQAQHEEIRAENQDRYIERMAREANSRLDAMKRFFEECGEDPKLCPRIYNPESFRRTVVAELLTALKDAGYESADLSQKVRRTDKRLRGYVQPSGFIWDETLMPVYPERPFWWLYHSPQA